jgi:nitroreductase
MVTNLPFHDYRRQTSVPFSNGFLHPAGLVDSPNAMMPLIDAIATRRTSRHYDSRLVPLEALNWLVTHAMHAPSACNEQKWKVIYIDDQSLFRELYERGSASFLREIKQCIILCYNSSTDNREWNDDVQSGAAFITVFQLLAHSIGIGSCWVCHLPNRSEIKRLFKIHRRYTPIALVSFGFYRSRALMHPRKQSATAVIHHNQFHSGDLSFRNRRGHLLRHLCRRLYYKLPIFLRRRLRAYALRYEKKFYFEIAD